MTNPTPGWYPDASGQTRWWDGTQWTEQVQPVQRTGFARWRSSPAGVVVLVVGAVLAVPTLIVLAVFVAGSIARR